MIAFLFQNYHANYSVNDFLTAFSPDNPQFWFVMFISGLTFLFGYLEYMYSFALVSREKSAPFPVWMHTFYFAHDSMGAIVFALAAIKYNHFWFFWVASIALMVWNCFEIYNLYHVIYTERHEIWGYLYKDGKTPVRDAWLKVIGQIFVMVTVVELFRVFMNDPLMFKWFIFTNIIMAIFPGLYWKKRNTQVGASKGLALVILLGTINSFIPHNMWAVVSPAFCFANNPWFYLAGIVAIAFAFKNLLDYDRLPKKSKLTKDGKKTIW